MATIVITGAASGIGLELARQYAARGDSVVAACRSRSAEMSGLKAEIHEGVEVTDDDAVARFVNSLAGRRVDVLINNAGMLTRETLETLDWDEVRREFEVNALGPLRVTRALLPNLGQGSKLAMITSYLGSIANNASGPFKGGYYGYRMSKAALNIASVNLSHELRPKGIAVLMLHPGGVKTKMTGGSGNVEAPDSARGLIARIDELTLETSGGFRSYDGGTLPW